MITKIVYQKGEHGVPAQLQQAVKYREETTVRHIARMRAAASNCDTNGLLKTLLEIDSYLSDQIVFDGFDEDTTRSLKIWERRRTDMIAQSFRNALSDSMFAMADQGCKCDQRR